MPWTIILEDEKGNAKWTLPNSFDYEKLDAIDLENFKLLKYIDPFGDTTFNHLQMNDLINDFKKLQIELPDSHQEIEKILELITECKKEIHHYIKFYGD